MPYKILKYLITICLTYKTPMITVFNVQKIEKIIPTARAFKIKNCFVVKQNMPYTRTYTKYVLVILC